MSEHGRIGFDPTAVEEQRSRHFFAAQIGDQPRVVSRTVGTAAGVEREENDLLSADGNSSDDAGDVFASGLGRLFSKFFFDLGRFWRG